MCVCVFGICQSYDTMDLYLNLGKVLWKISYCPRSRSLRLTTFYSRERQSAMHLGISVTGRFTWTVLNATSDYSRDSVSLTETSHHVTQINGRSFPSSRPVALTKVRESKSLYNLPMKRRHGFMPFSRALIRSGMWTNWSRIWTWFS